MLNLIEKLRNKQYIKKIDGSKNVYSLTVAGKVIFYGSRENCQNLEKALSNLRK